MLPQLQLTLVTIFVAACTASQPTPVPGELCVTELNTEQEMLDVVPNAQCVLAVDSTNVTSLQALGHLAGTTLISGLNVTRNVNLSSLRGIEDITIGALNIAENQLTGLLKVSNSIPQVGITRESATKLELGDVTSVYLTEMPELTDVTIAATGVGDVRIWAAPELTTIATAYEAIDVLAIENAPKLSAETLAELRGKASDGASVHICGTVDSDPCPVNVPEDEG